MRSRKTTHKKTTPKGLLACYLYLSHCISICHHFPNYQRSWQSSGTNVNLSRLAESATPAAITCQLPYCLIATWDDLDSSCPRLRPDFSLVAVLNINSWHGLLVRQPDTLHWKTSNDPPLYSVILIFVLKASLSYTPKGIKTLSAMCYSSGGCQSQVSL